MTLLAARLAHPPSTAGEPVGVCFIKWVTALAVSFARHVMRSVLHTVVLIVAIAPNLKIVRGVVVASSIGPVSYLHTYRYGSPIECRPHQAVNELARILTCFAADHHHLISLLVDEREKFPLTEVLTSTVSCMDDTVNRAHSTFVRRFVHRESRDTAPFLTHNHDNTCTDVVGGERGGREVRDRLLTLMS